MTAWTLPAHAYLACLHTLPHHTLLPFFYLPIKRHGGADAGAFYRITHYPPPTTTHPGPAPPHHYPPLDGLPVHIPAWACLACLLLPSLEYLTYACSPSSAHICFILPSAIPRNTRMQRATGTAAFGRSPRRRSARRVFLLPSGVSCTLTPISFHAFNAAYAFSALPARQLSLSQHPAQHALDCATVWAHIQQRARCRNSITRRHLLSCLLFLRHFCLLCRPRVRAVAAVCGSCHTPCLPRLGVVPRGSRCA